MNLSGICRQTFDCDCGDPWSKCSHLRLNLEIIELKKEIEKLKEDLRWNRRAFVRIIDYADDALKEVK